MLGQPYPRHCLVRFLKFAHNGEVWDFINMECGEHREFGIFNYHLFHKVTLPAQTLEQRVTSLEVHRKLLESRK